MRSFVLAVLLLLGLPAPLAAQTLQRLTLRGVAHELAVPPGWTARLSDVGAELSPPAGPGRRLKVALVGTEHVGGGDARQILDKLVDGEKQNKPHYAQSTQPEEISFAGAAGQITILAGSKPGGEMEGEMLVVSVAGGTVYLFSAEGPLADLNGNVDDLAAIIGGLRRVDGKAAAPDADTAGELGDLIRGTGGKDADRPPQKRWLSDPAFGLELRPLRFWRFALADDEYQIERTNETPAAVLSIRRVPVKNRAAYLKAAQKRGRHKDGKLAGVPALIVERGVGDTLERTYHLVRGDFALELEFRVVARAGASGLDARVFEVEQALELPEAGVSRWSDGTTELTSFAGVRLTTTPGWKLAAISPGRANFRGERGVDVEVRVRPFPADDPFAKTEEQIKSACGKAAYSRSEAAVLGSTQAARFRCATGKGAQAVLLVAGQGAGGEKILVTVTGKQKGRAPDAAIAEFGAYLALPR